jgi:uroporphyrinogen III methyltransferase/synthase
VTVYLVGAGPGDPGLLTVRAAEVLRSAQVVVHDRLVEPGLLDLAAGAERIDVGKAPGGPVDQEQINQILIERGRVADRVVRLKGGDPFVFGRGGEEALALAAAGVAFEVVPGITSAIAVPAYAGVPVTHRGLATSFTVVTGHSRFSVDQETNWEALAAAGGTIVVLMGVAHRGRIAERLMAGGLAADTPVAAVRWGTRPDQTSVRTTLGALGDTPLEPPVTLVIGAVAGLDVGWYENRPLFGRSVVVTRAREQASALSDQLRRLGAQPLEVPTIAVGPPSDGGAALAAAVARLGAGHYDWVVFTSANAVTRTLELVRDARSLGLTRVAAIGPGTTAELARRWLVPDLVPARSVAEGLLEAWPAARRGGRDGGGGRILLPRAEVGRDVFPDGARAAGWEVDVVPAYRTVMGQVGPAVLDAAIAADAICFTSASTVDNYLAVAGPDAVPPVVACIGPATATRARDHGIAVTVVADDHSIPGLVAALRTALAGPVTGVVGPLSR